MDSPSSALKDPMNGLKLATTLNIYFLPIQIAMSTGAGHFSHEALRSPDAKAQAAVTSQKHKAMANGGTKPLSEVHP
jgi:hypothetical protein